MMVDKRNEIENSLKSFLVESLSSNGYTYSVDNFLLDVDNPYQATILDFSSRFEKEGKSIGNHNWCGYIDYSVTLQVPLSSTTETESREEARRVERAIMFALIRLERCTPVKAITNVIFIKSVVQDQYRSIELPGALMLEVGAFFQLQYVEDFSS